MANRLISEKSPYLRQHAGNPVDWHPWGEEALAAAKRLNRPIFLSIGYSSCHWCHVMERESFEDAETARLLNDGFVSVKVDREERPDIDAHFMAVCQMLTGSGGWPLTVFLTPDGQPFFAGTYFPKEPRFGLMGFKDLITRIAGAWETGPRELQASAQRIAAALRESGDGPPRGARPGLAVLDKGFAQLSAEYDRVHGGFGGAPKFPQAHRLFFLLRYADRTGNRQALEMVENTLLAMRRGGIFDQLGFGFHRYSTDPAWRTPHFEKMLCDQALLAMAYSEAFQLTGRAEFGTTAEEILAYVLRELASPEGGFLTSEDADSDGAEGRFYLWEAGEVMSSLPRPAAELAVQAFGLGPETDSGATGSAGAGPRALRLAKPLPGLAGEFGVSPSDLLKKIDAVRARLLAVRERRPRPFKDTKVLTDWNGLMIAALAKAARALGRDDFHEAADRAVAFIRDRLLPDGRLMHRYADGEPGIAAFLDDFAFLIWGLIEVYETGYDPEPLAWALRLTDELMRDFWDGARGGFFLTRRESRDLPVRRKDAYDGAGPSGNSVMAGNLLRLGRLTGRPDLEDAAARTFDAWAGSLSRAPAAHAQLLCGLDFAFGPTREIVVVGALRDAATRRLLAPLRKKFLPRATVIFIPADQDSAPVLELAPYARAMTSVEGRPTAYVCSGFRCQRPTSDPKVMLKGLGSRRSRLARTEKKR